MAGMKSMIEFIVAGIAGTVFAASAAMAAPGALRLDLGSSLVLAHGCHHFCYRTGPRDPGHYHKGTVNCIRLSCLPRPNPPRR